MRRNLSYMSGKREKEIGKDGERMRKWEKEEKEKQIISCRLSHFWGRGRKTRERVFFFSTATDPTERQRKIQRHHILRLICCTHTHTHTHSTVFDLFEWEDYLLQSFQRRRRRKCFFLRHWVFIRTSNVPSESQQVNKVRQLSSVPLLFTETRLKLLSFPSTSAAFFFLSQTSYDFTSKL